MAVAGDDVVQVVAFRRQSAGGRARSHCGWLGALALALLPGGIALPAGASVQSELAFHRGVVAYGETRYPDARAEFEAVLREDPEDISALHYLGLIAQAQGDPAAAVAAYERALALDEEDNDIRLDLGTALLEAGRTEEARTAFDRVLAAEPDRAQAQLYAGISDYRVGAYDQAIPHLERAMQLDPALRVQAQYYAGLASAFMGDTTSASASFADVVDAGPQSPLANSAANLRNRIQPTAETRRWDLAFTTGVEWDSNPRVVGTLLDRKPDGRGVFRLRGSVRAWEGERTSLSGGFDSYLSTQFHETKVDLQTHVLWANGGIDLDPVRLGLRFDWAYTFIDLTQDFRRLYRVTPTIAIREGERGVSQLFYQFQNQNFFTPPELPVVPPAFFPLDRTGNQHSFGINQYFFAPEPFSYLRLGALGDFQRSDGSDFDYDGFEVSAGAGLSLPYELDLTLLYRYVYRNYQNPNSLAFPDPPVPGVVPAVGFATQRKDSVSWLTVDLARPITEHWEVSLGGSFGWQYSTVDAYRYDRFIVGSYATYRF